MKKIIGILLLMLALAVSSLAADVLIYEANFDKTDSKKVDWMPVSGEWDIYNGKIINYDANHNNTNIYQELEQFGAGLFIYEYKFIPENKTKDFTPAVGLHFMASDGEDASRGDSYLIFQDANEAQIYRARNGILGSAIVQEPGFGCALGKETVIRVEYDNTTGLIVVYVNGKKAAEWTDSEPIEEGLFISLRSNSTAVSYDYVKVWFRKK